MALKGKKYVWICIAPAMILIMAFLIYPLIKTVIYSFSSWYNFALTSEWIGLDNYKRIFSDMVMPVAFKNTAILIAGVLIFQVGFALLLAIMVDSAPITDLNCSGRFTSSRSSFPVRRSA